MKQDKIELDQLKDNKINSENNFEIDRSDSPVYKRKKIKGRKQMSVCLSGNQESFQNQMIYTSGQWDNLNQSNTQNYEKLQKQRIREYSMNKKLKEKFEKEKNKANSQIKQVEMFSQTNSENIDQIKNDLQKQNNCMFERLKNRRNKSISKSIAKKKILMEISSPDLVHNNKVHCTSINFNPDLSYEQNKNKDTSDSNNIDLNNKFSLKERMAKEGKVFTITESKNTLSIKNYHSMSNLDTPSKFKQFKTPIKAKPYILDSIDNSYINVSYIF